MPTTTPQTCYDMSGNENRLIFACDPSVYPTACCAPNDICLSNGLCKPKPGAPNEGGTAFYYDGCTDPSFNSTRCLSNCLDIPGFGVKACGSGKYCCYGDTNCDCSNSTQVFTLDAGTEIATISNSTAIASSTQISSTAKSASIAASTTPASATLPSSSAMPSSTGAPSKSLSTGGKVGIGLGAASGGFALLLVAVVLVRRQRQEMRADPTPVDGQKVIEYSHELHVEERPTELALGGYADRAELDGSMQR